MQTRFIGLGLAILMMAGACGGSDSTDTSASPLPTEPATSSPTDSSTATTGGPPTHYRCARAHDHHDSGSRSTPHRSAGRGRRLLGIMDQHHIRLDR